MKRRLAVPLLSLLVLLAVLAGCSADRSSTRPGFGTVQVRMTDAPGDYDQVNIVVEEVRIHQTDCDGDTSDTGGNGNGNGRGKGNPGGGCWTVISSGEATYDLLQLQNGVFVTLATGRTVPAGSYDRIVLVLGEGSNVVVDGVTYPLKVPGGAHRGVVIEGDFTVPDEGTADVLLDFDADRSIKKLGHGQYMLQPFIRMVQGTSSGEIHGMLEPATEAQIDAMQGDQEIAGTRADEEGNFRISALPAGTYDLRVDVADGYRDTTLTGVVVSNGQVTELGTIVLTADTTATGPPQ